VTPFEQARRLCFLRGGCWADELEAFMADGFVLSTPTVFAMGRMCEKADHFPDPWEHWPEGESFFAWQVCGDLREVVRHLPLRPLYLGWFRQGRGWKRNHWISLTRIESALAKPVARC
jgi:hypothetical protein